MLQLRCRPSQSLLAASSHATGQRRDGRWTHRVWRDGRGVASGRLHLCPSEVGQQGVECDEQGEHKCNDAPRCASAVLVDCCNMRFNRFFISSSSTATLAIVSSNPSAWMTCMSRSQAYASLACVRVVTVSPADCASQLDSTEAVFAHWWSLPLLRFALR